MARQGSVSHGFAVAKGHHLTRRNGDLGLVIREWSRGNHRHLVIRRRYLAEIDAEVFIDQMGCRKGCPAQDIAQFGRAVGEQGGPVRQHHVEGAVRRNAGGEFS